MPEGDTLFRAASVLRPVLVGHIVQTATTTDPKVDATRLMNTTVGSVEARGKHLLIHFGDDCIVHSHLGMTGSWHVYTNGQPWRKPASRAALTIETATHTIVLFSPKLLELLTPTGLRRHRWLNRLGPDILSESFEQPEVLQVVIDRLRAHNNAPLGHAIMNQATVCGIGNVYKSEMLFLHRLNPFAAVGEFDDDVLQKLLLDSRRLMRRNLIGTPRRTRFGRDGNRKWVYGRGGEPCYECGATIAMRRQGDLGRSTYFCPSCQHVA